MKDIHSSTLRQIAHLDKLLQYGAAITSITPTLSSAMQGQNSEKYSLTDQN